jgi:hypothetical protein
VPCQPARLIGPLVVADDIIMALLVLGARIYVGWKRE